MSGKGSKFPPASLNFTFPFLSPSLLLDSSLQKVEGERREIREQNMPPNFSSTLEDGRRRAQAVGQSPQPAPHPAVPSSPQPPPCSRYALLPAPASASPPLLPSGGASRPLLFSPLLQCSFPSCLFLLLPRLRGCSTARSRGCVLLQSPQQQLGKATACARTFARD